MGTTRPRVVADHPFVFFIYNKNYRTIIFEGVVNKPTEAQDIKQRSQYGENDGQFPYNIQPNYPTPKRY